MPAPHFEITTPPGFQISSEPSQIGQGLGGLWVAPIAAADGRWGVVLARQARPGTVRSMVVYSQELARLIQALALV